MKTGRYRSLEIVRFIVNSVLLGAGLAMDAFSVSVVNGMHEPGMSSGKKLKIAGVFAGFQTLMPLLGWVLVHTLLQLIKQAEGWIPWIAFVLLFLIGGKMVLEGVTNSGDDRSELTKHRLTPAVLVVQGIATSIDALSVGFTIADYKIWTAIIAALIIGVVTFVICRIGLVLGVKVGTKLNRHASIIGGIILIGIGVEILISHLVG